MFRTMLAPQTPSAGITNALAQPVKPESNSVPLPGPRAPPQAPIQQNSANGSSNRPQGPPPPLSILQPHPKPAEANSTTTVTSALSGTPPLDSSYSADPNPPVGFFTARAAESLQKGTALPTNVPAFNPHLESPSIRKTAGIDHTKTKPVRTESIGLPAAAGPPRTNFVNPQADRARRVGMPATAASPLQNRGSYKPPQMKRPAEGAVAQ